ncbi:MAG TPA: serine/threonine protein kinase [Armatimonadota bacterium]|jgi:serine/threonine-protein kinase
MNTVSQPLDDVTVRLREPHDLAFLRDIGRVFQVFDQQDSGNVGFGVDTGAEKLFVKYAGARTTQYGGDPADAVVRLKAAIPAYAALEHPALVRLRDHFAVGDGYAAVFDWFPGECLHEHWAFTREEKYTNPRSPSCRFQQLPLPRRMETLHAIFAFHEHVAHQGYVAIDFYDGSIMYDFAHLSSMICDIDMYAPLPYTNGMGRMWGSSRFMSPEECELGAEIDEITNVYTMGATAFGLLGGDRNRTLEGWSGNRAQYEVAWKAVSADRRVRYPSLSAFRLAWSAATDAG